MEITIIGWYGTETIGDRAILAGIFRILSDSIGEFSIRLGSLYPFYSQRTVLEDITFYKKAARNPNLSITIFDSRNPYELKSNIKKSDVLMVGGGPLMDLREMSMLEYAFYLAYRYEKKSVIMGSGWGPLKTQKAIEIAKRLICFSSLIIFRDDISKEQAIGAGCKTSNLYSLIDPAFIACNVFLEEVPQSTSAHISVNFRDVSLEGDHYLKGCSKVETFANIVQQMLSQSHLPIHLVPMHNFFIGGDDRIILNDIARQIDTERVSVIHTPLSLQETMSEYYNAAYCVGMRFHSILLQTVLNGKNFIVDYTNPQNGKIKGMMEKINMREAYKSRYYSLHNGDEMPIIKLNEMSKFKLSEGLITNASDEYVRLFKQLI